MASNVPGFEQPEFILDLDENKLLSQMVNYMRKVSDQAYELAKDRWKSVFNELEKLEENVFFARSRCQ